MSYYEMIFKRKSFHLFRKTESINENELKELQEFIEVVKPSDF